MRGLFMTVLNPKCRVKCIQLTIHNFTNKLHQLKYMCKQNKNMSQIMPLDATLVTSNTVKKLLTSLVNYGTLAPSSHNTQCWKFSIDTSNIAITVHPDFERRCPIVDPDDHHVYATLGCAVENIVVAATAHGWEATVDLSDLLQNGIRISFRQCEVQESELFDAIPERQCTR